MTYIGDFPEDWTTVSIFFTTHDGNGAPVAPLSAFEADDVKIYKNGDAAQKTSTNGLTMTSPFDSITGLHRLLIDTSNDTGDSGFWTAGASYTVVLNPDTETVNSQTALKVIGTFSLAMNLRSTTNGRTLDVSSGGEAGVDWANVGSPTTTLNLSGTTVKTATDVEADTQDIQSRLPAALVSGRIDASVGAMASGVLTATAIAADAITDAKVASDVTIASVTGAVGSVTGNVGGNVTGTIGGLTAAALKDFFDTDTTTTYGSAVSGSVVKEIADNAGGSALTASAIADEVQTRTIAAVTTVNGLANNSVTAAALAADAGTEIATAVWASGTRSLTVLDEDSTTLDLDATIRAAVGLASANLDTQLDALPTTAEVNAEVDTALADVGLTTTITGRIDAPISSRLAAASISLSGGAVTVGTNNDKTGYSLSQTFPSNFASLAITAAGKVTVGTNDDKTGYALTSGERTSIANEVEAQIIDETDSEKVLTAITDKIAAVNPDLSGLTLSAIASSVWSNGTRTLTTGAPTADEIADEVETRTLLADIRKVNNIAVTGAGTSGNPWGPA